MSGEHHVADLGAIWRRKRSKETFSLIWIRSWSILEGIWIVLEGFSMIDHGLLMRFLKELSNSSIKFLKHVPSNFQTTSQRTNKSTKLWQTNGLYNNCGLAECARHVSIRHPRGEPFEPIFKFFQFVAEILKLQKFMFFFPKLAPA